MKSRKYMLSHFVLLIYAMVCILPLILLISASITTDAEFVKSGIGIIPKQPTLQAYKIIFEYPQTIINAYKVTTLVTVVGTAINLLMCALCAYPLSRESFRYKGRVSLYIYFTMMFGGGLIPFYMLVSKYLQLSDTIWCLLLPPLAPPMIIFLLRTYFRHIPPSLLEAARIDGATEWKSFFRIALPLAKPGLATAGLMITLTYWNDWNNAMLFVSEPELFTLQLLLQRLTDFINSMKYQQSAVAGSITTAVELPSNAAIMATCLIAAGPMMMVFLLFQKHFVGGITVGAVKE